MRHHQSLRETSKATRSLLRQLLRAHLNSTMELARRIPRLHHNSMHIAADLTARDTRDIAVDRVSLAHTNLRLLQTCQTGAFRARLASVIIVNRATSVVHRLPELVVIAKMTDWLLLWSFFPVALEALAIPGRTQSIFLKMLLQYQ